MNRVLTLLLLLLFQFSSLYASEQKYKGNMGYLVDGLNDIKYKDARIAFDLWIGSLGKGEGIDASIIYYEKIDNILEDFKNFKFDYVSVNTYFLLSHQEVFYDLSKEFWTVQKSDELYEDYVLLVRKDSKIEKLEDLKSKTILLRDDDYIGRMILDKEIIEATHHSSSDYLQDRSYVNKFSTAILKTFFGKVDACLVPSYALKLVAEMNPNVLKKLTTVYKSKKIFIPMIAGFHEKTDEGLIHRFSKKVVRLHETVRGQNILDLFKMKKLVRMEKEELNAIIEYHEEYNKLKRKYKIEEEILF